MIYGSLKFYEAKEIYFHRWGGGEMSVNHLNITKNFIPKKAKTCNIRPFKKYSIASSLMLELDFPYLYYCLALYFSACW